MTPARRTQLLLLSTFVASGVALACDRPSEDLPEWTARDHNHQKEAQPNQFDAAAPPKPGMPALEKYGISQVVLATWKQNCVPCHGLIGAGDGPQGPMMRPTDLTNAKWQKVSLDSEIAHTIKNGRGRMPAFGQLPDETVTGLIRLIRMMNPERPREAEPAEGAPASGKMSPHGSAPAGAAPGGVAPRNPAAGALPPGHP